MRRSEKRDNGSGTIHRRADGRFAGQVRLGAGKRKTVYGETKAEVRAAIRELRRAVEDGEVITTDRRVTFAAYAPTYLSTTIEARVTAGTMKRSTAEWHAAMLRHALPVLGAKRLDAITPSDIERLVVRLRDVAASTRRGVFTATSAMLDAAVRDGLLPRNPAASVRRPTATSAEAAHLTIEQIREIVDRADDPAMRAAVLVLATTGLRRGELLALRWCDVDLDAGTVRVTGTVTRTATDGLTRTEPKSRRSKRIVGLPAVAVEALRPLRGVGEAPVFPSRAGGFQEPRNFTRRFVAVAGVGPHTLRHSAATAMVAAGVPLTVVSDVLGHADVRVTAGTYAHVIEEQRKAAGDTLGALLA